MLYCVDDTANAWLLGWVMCESYVCGLRMLHNQHYVAPIKPNHLARLRFPDIVIYPDKMSDAIEDLARVA